MIWRYFRRKKSQPPTAGPGDGAYGHEDPPERPFGEDITNPDSRMVPPEYRGVWVHDLGESDTASNRTRTVIDSERIVIGGSVQHVVAVRFIDRAEAAEFDLPVAVVTRPAGTDEKAYSLHYFGLTENGNSLVDLENMDWVLRRSSL